MDGISFPSKSEARRYVELRDLEQLGSISDLELQPKFSLKSVTGNHICNYIADFRYVDKETGKTVVEDVKGVRTSIFNLKAKWYRDMYEEELRIVK